MAAASGNEHLSLGALLNLLTEAREVDKLITWPNGETHRLIRCKCGVPMKRRSGVRGPFWGCSNWGSKDKTTCNQILNDAKEVMPRFKTMQRHLERQFNLTQEEEYVAAGPIESTKKHPPRFRALFSPVGVRLRDLVGAARIDHVAPLADALPTPSEAGTLYFMEEVFPAGFMKINQRIMEEGSATTTMEGVEEGVVAADIVKEVDLNIEVDLDPVLQAAIDAEPRSVAKKTGVAKIPLPTVQLQVPPSPLESDALLYLNKHLLNDSRPFANAELGLLSNSHDSTCKDGQELLALNDALRKTVIAISTDPHPRARTWLNAANTVTRASAGIHYYLHHNERVVTIAVVEPWVYGEETILPLNWKGFGEFDVGFVSASQAELWLVPVARVDSSSDDSRGADQKCLFQWRFVNASRLRTLLWQHENDINAMPLRRLFTNDGVRDLTYLAPLQRLGSLNVQTLIDETAEECSRAESATTANEFHNSHAEQLRCGEACRHAPTDEMTEGEAFGRLANAAAKVCDLSQEVSDPHEATMLDTYFSFVTATRESDAAPAYDRFLIARLENANAFFEAYNLYQNL